MLDVDETEKIIGTTGVTKERPHSCCFYNKCSHSHNGYQGMLSQISNTPEPVLYWFANFLDPLAFRLLENAQICQNVYESSPIIDKGSANTGPQLLRACNKQCFATFQCNCRTDVVCKHHHFQFRHYPRANRNQRKMLQGQMTVRITNVTYQLTTSQHTRLWCKQET